MKSSFPAWAAAVGAATFVAFLPALGADFVSFDDGVNFVRNPHYRGFSAENLAWMFSDVKGHYMPLTWLTLALDYSLWGMDARGYHFTSLVLHVANALLFFRVLEILVARAGAADPLPRRAGAAGALLYAVHPLRVESVAWVTERRDVLCGLFFLLSILFYLKSLEDPARRRKRLAASIVFFACSLLSKTLSMALPFVLVILDAYPLRRRELREKIPFFALFVGAVVLTWFTQRAAGALTVTGYAAVDRLTQPGYRIGFYVLKTLWPSRLQPAYLWPDDPSPLRPWAVGGLLVLGAATVAVWLARRRWPAATAAWFAFGVLLAPVAGFFQAGPHFAADRYTYFAGFAAAAVAAVPLVRFPWLAAALIAVLGGLSFRQSGYWTSSARLWDRALAVEPDNALARTNRGLLRSETGDLDGALADYDVAIRSAPRQPRAHSGRARVLLMRGDGPGAQAAADEAIRLDPGFAAGWECRGAAKILRKDLEGALSDLDRALALDPAATSALSNRAAVRRHQGNLDGAIADYEKALSVDAKDVEASLALAQTLETRGRRSGSQADLRAARDRYARIYETAPPGPLRQEAARALERLRVGPR